MNYHPLHLFKYCPCCGSSKFEINNFKSKKCGNCGFVYYFNSAAATAAFIIDNNGNLLVAKRAHEPAKGTLDLPGGFVDMYESAEEAIIREVKEETGLEINKPGYLYSIPNIYVYSDLKIHTLDMFFEVIIENAFEIQAADDVSELIWMKREDINPELFGLSSIRKAVEKWLLTNNKVG